MLFTENETNTERIFGVPNRSPFVKDSINDYIVLGKKDALNPANQGTKVSAHYQLLIGPGQRQVIRLRFTDAGPDVFAKASTNDGGPIGTDFQEVFASRRREADEFYATVIPASLNADAAIVMPGTGGDVMDQTALLLRRGPMAGRARLRSVQTYPQDSPRNDQWHHMYNGEVISMPDKWEYPWYAAWDLAFHVLALTLVDTDLGKQQLKLMLRERTCIPTAKFQRTNGTLAMSTRRFMPGRPFSRTAWRRRKQESATTRWLKSCFQKLLLNFTWWVNRKDRSGRNVFEGGFLGLDNIGVFDRSSALPTGGYLEQADGTAWMALFCQNMLEIAIELAQTDADYADMSLKFCEHFLWIASSLAHVGHDTGMWDEEDGFFYDVLRLPDGQAQRLKVRSMVGLLPLCAVTAFEGELMAKYPEIGLRFRRFLDARPELMANIHDPQKRGVAGRRLASILDESKLRRVLSKMLDENEFLSPYGLRSLSRYHADHPYVFHAGGQEYRVAYLPAESDSGMFGGNSNWRGPIWVPVNALIIRALLQYYTYYGDDFTVECPTGSGRRMTLYQVAEEIARRLSNIFLRDETGKRPVFGGEKKFQENAHWRDHLLFYEYFHGDNGAGLGASHQTGWTGVIARSLHLFATMKADQVLQFGRNAAFALTESTSDVQSREGASRVHQVPLPEIRYP